jgi:hypothetical protein
LRGGWPQGRGGQRDGFQESAAAGGFGHLVRV